MCYGSDSGKLIFETGKPPAASAESMTKRLAQVQAGVAIKPEFLAGRDESAVSDEPPAPVDVPKHSDTGASQAQVSGPAPDDKDRQAWEKLLPVAQKKVVELRDGGSPLVSKVSPLFEFAVEKAKAGDHGLGAKTLQKLLELVVSSAKSAAAKSEPVKPKTTQRARKPIEQGDARNFITQLDLEEPEEDVKTATAELLDDMKTALKQANRMVTVANVDELAQAMADANGITKNEAAQMIANNKGRGFTAPNGTVNVLGNTPEAAHDEVHETVHLMSAPGGATKIMADYGEQLNEAFTEFFTKQMCAKLGVKDAVAYP
jgi:hypothetical protein